MYFKLNICEIFTAFEMWSSVFITCSDFSFLHRKIYIPKNVLHDHIKNFAPLKLHADFSVSLTCQNEQKSAY